MNKLILWLLIMVFPVCAWAHTPSSSYLFINEIDSTINLRWDIALRDLEYVMGLDTDQNQQITWQELKEKQQAINAYALSHLSIKQGEQGCQLTSSTLQVVEHADGSYAVLNLDPICTAKTQGESLTINYSLLFDEDANHRGVVLDQRTSRTQSYIASIDQPQLTIESHKRSPLINFATFVKQGVWHILIGYDHILFIITLMLPAVLRYRHKQWQAVDAFKPAMLSLLKVVTAFTVAHSITLSLATLNIIALPARSVESAIALSVVLVAINNLKPLFTHARWGMAFIFGLIHGFGFASVLGDLNLDNGSLVWSLLGFNIGVEIGQALILGVLFPVAYYLRKTRVYRTAILQGGSVIISVLASFWLVQRLAL